MILDLNTKTNPIGKPFEISWIKSKHNIIYLNFNGLDIDFINSLAPHIKNYINIPQTKLMNYTVRPTDYIKEVKKKLKNIKFLTKLSKNIIGPVIYDLGPAVLIMKNLIMSRGPLLVWPEILNLISSVYKSLKDIEQYNKALGTTLIIDFKDNEKIFESFKLFLKNNKFEIDISITDHYIIVPVDQKEFLAIYAGEFIRPVIMKYEKEFLHHTEEINITVDMIKEAVRQKLNKEITTQEADYLKSIVNKFINKFPDIKISLGDSNSIADVIEKSLKYLNDAENSEAGTFEELLAAKLETMRFSRSVDPDKMDKSSTGVNALKTTKVKWFTDPERTKQEFNEILTKQIDKIVESLDDERFGFRILGVTKEVVDDGKSRFYIYKIKVKPLKGTSYAVQLRIPALVHGTYFKMDGNYYAINNQLMQKPLIKKADNIVQLKTNYSVINYSIKSSKLENKGFESLIEYALNLAKNKKKLKSAEVMNEKTEAILKEYEVPSDVISSLRYSKIELKD